MRGACAADTRFETGSLTKTFTALLLAELVARREVRYHDPVARYLPRALPGGPPVTLLHLATHTSGLPRQPRGCSRAPRGTAGSATPTLRTPRRPDGRAPRTRLHHRPGTRVRYSNFGVGLLGHALARAAGGSYPELLAERVLRPLGLADTDCDPGRPQAPGHWHGRPRPPWLIPALPAAGALRSSGRDMLTLLTALLAPERGPRQSAGRAHRCAAAAAVPAPEREPPLSRLEPPPPAGPPAAPPLRRHPGLHRLRGLPPGLRHRAGRLRQRGPDAAGPVRPGGVRDTVRAGRAPAGPRGFISRVRRAG
ncbi:serine hydrolase domain-containing protein [Streptomyces stramineus]